jgi:hypothetical protein
MTNPSAVLLPTSFGLKWVRIVSPRFLMTSKTTTTKRGHREEESFERRKTGSILRNFTV